MTDQQEDFVPFHLRPGNEHYVPQKEYYDTNPEYRERRRQQWRDYGKKRSAVKVTCPCGSTVSAHYLKRHENSQKHKIFIATKKPETPKAPEPKVEKDTERCDMCGYREFNCHCGLPGYGFEDGYEYLI